MKHNAFTFLIALIVSAISSAAFAGIPAELAALVPTGKEHVRYDGKLPNGQKCVVQMAKYTDAFDMAIFLMGADGSVEKVAKMQIGFGHALQKYNATATEITSQTYHVAEEQYSSDSRSITTIKLAAGIPTQVKIKEEAKRKLWFGYSTTAELDCRL